MQTKPLEKMIEREPVGKKMRFILDLHERNIRGNWHYFEQFVSDFGRWVKDPKMDLETFLGAYRATERPFTKLVVGRDERIPGTLDSVPCIQVYIGHVYPKEMGGQTESVARYFCPLTDENYETMDRIFRDNFGKSIEEYN